MASSLRHALVLVAMLSAPSCAPTAPSLEHDYGGSHVPLPPPERGLPPDPTKRGASGGLLTQVERDPMSEAIFPCSDCHADQEPNPVVRELKERHGKVPREHGGESMWCLHCHDLTDRDQLRLADGERIPFEESHLLCGQCHGAKLSEWKVGVHGKRVGMWNGDQEYLTCLHCHDPHSPKFKPIKPEPPPLRPTDIRR